MRIFIEPTDMHPIYNHSAPKKPTNLSVNSDLLLKARGLKINLSATFESALEAQVRISAREQWQKDNRETLARLNKHAEKNGLFSDLDREL